MTIQYRTIDLFAGAGGLTLGFERSGLFKSVFAVEYNADAAQTYHRNFGLDLVMQGETDTVDFPKDNVIFCGDIRRVRSLGFGADIVIGGPPCQGFSPLGKFRPREEHAAMNQLWQQYMRVVHQVRPLAFVIENVPELLRSDQYVAIELTAKKLGYTVTSGTLKAVEFGVPQQRVRAFIIGMLGGIIPELPKGSGTFRTVRDAIGDLPLEPTTKEVTELPGVPENDRRRRQDLHIGRTPTPKSVERYMQIDPGESRFALMKKRPDLTPDCWKNKPTGTADVFGRLEWDKPALTIRTEFYKPEKGRYLHPTAHRPITHREAARLQTFDDWFYFHGSKIEIARQIGNAVPPDLGRAVADAVSALLPVVAGQIKRGWTVPTVASFEAMMAEAQAEADIIVEAQAKAAEQAKHQREQRSKERQQRTTAAKPAQLSLDISELGKTS